MEGIPAMAGKDWGPGRKTAFPTSSMPGSLLVAESRRKYELPNPVLALDSKVFKLNFQGTIKHRLPMSKRLHLITSHNRMIKRFNCR